MVEEWLEIRDDQVDTEQIVQLIRARLESCIGSPSNPKDENPAAMADALWREMIRDTQDYHVPVRERECDIVPRNYAIDWRVPILGPVHAAVRRVINAEIRRYLMPSLERQSYINRQLVRFISDLTEENENLRREVAELRKTRNQGTT